MELQELLCKNCGAKLDPSTIHDGVVECPVCYSKFVVAKEKTSPRGLNQIHLAEMALVKRDFDSAYALYQSAAKSDSEEPEAYFGMAQAVFGVVYVKDYIDNCLRPISYRISAEKFSEDKNYKLALKYASPVQKIEYKKRAEEIDAIRNEFFKLKQEGEDYDCFICVKVSDMRGGKTDDSNHAHSIYDLLKKKGYNPFFSERCIGNRTGSDYEAMILYALYTSETMLVVCSDERYLATPWVKNEYSRFLQMVNEEDKESDSITVVFNGKPIERLPGKTGKIQGIDYSQHDANEKIVEFVDVHTPLAKQRKKEAAEEKKRRAEEEKRAREEEKKLREEQDARIKEELAYIKSRMSETQSSSGAPQKSVVNVLKRASIELEDGHFDKAYALYDSILEDNPTEANAWFGSLLVEQECASHEGLLEKIEQVSNRDAQSYRLLFNLSKSTNYKHSVEYATGMLKTQLEELDKAITQRVSVLCEDVNPYARDFYRQVISSADAHDYGESTLENANYALYLLDNGVDSDEELSTVIKSANNIDAKSYRTLFKVLSNPYYVQLQAQFSKSASAKKAQEFCKSATDKILALCKEVSHAAREYLTYVLKSAKDMTPEARAYAAYGLYLLDNDCSSEEELLNKIKLANGEEDKSYRILFNTMTNDNYEACLRFGDLPVCLQAREYRKLVQDKMAELSRKVSAKSVYFLQRIKTDELLDMETRAFAAYGLFLLENDCTSGKALQEKIDVLRYNQASELVSIGCAFDSSDSNFQFAYENFNAEWKKYLTQLRERYRNKLKLMHGECNSILRNEAQKTEMCSKKYANRFKQDTYTPSDFWDACTPKDVLLSKFLLLRLALSVIIGVVIVILGLANGKWMYMHSYEFGALEGFVEFMAEDMMTMTGDRESSTNSIIGYLLSWVVVFAIYTVGFALVAFLFTMVVTFIGYVIFRTVQLAFERMKFEQDRQSAVRSNMYAAKTELERTLKGWIAQLQNASNRLVKQDAMFQQTVETEDEQQTLKNL